MMAPPKVEVTMSVSADTCFRSGVPSTLTLGLRDRASMLITLLRDYNVSSLSTALLKSSLRFNDCETGEVALSNIVTDKGSTHVPSSCFRFCPPPESFIELQPDTPFLISIILNTTFSGRKRLAEHYADACGLPAIAKNMKCQCPLILEAAVSSGVHTARRTR
jgi:hypothetical protein